MSLKLTHSAYNSSTTHSILKFYMSVCIRSADVTVINAIEMCAVLVDLFWAIVYLSIASLQADCLVRCGVFLKICSKLLVVLLS